MDFVELVRLLVRRRWIVTLGLVLSLGAAAGSYVATPPGYVSGSQVIVLLPPTAGSAEGETNPFLNLPSGLVTLARVVTVVPNSPDFRDSMVRDGHEASYTVEQQPNSPIVAFSVEGSDPEGVVATRDELLRRFEAELRRIQTEENVPDRQFAHVRVLEASASATPVSSGRLRSAALAGVAGAALTLFVAIRTDRRDGRRRVGSRDGG